MYRCMCVTRVWGGKVAWNKRERERQRNWQRRSSRVVPRKLRGKRSRRRSQVHLTRTATPSRCVRGGRRINRCHHGDRTLVARRHGLMPRSGSTFATPSPAATQPRRVYIRILYSCIQYSCSAAAHVHTHLLY